MPNRVCLLVVSRFKGMEGRIFSIALEIRMRMGTGRLPQAQSFSGIPWSCMQVDDKAEYLLLQDHSLHQIGQAWRSLFFAVKNEETITGNLYQTQLVHLRQELNDRRLQYNKRPHKGILQHHNAKLQVAKVFNTYLETFKWEMIHTWRILQTLILWTTT